MTTTLTRREGIALFIPASPLAAQLGIEVGELGDGTATLRLPFAERNATMADVVHGGAIAALADTAAMAASWATDEPMPADPSGATVSLHTDFLAAARGCDLEAQATVLRRGGRLCFVRVDVRGDGELVATASATYRVGG